MKLDPSILARIQFAFTVSFHIMFPTMSIGLASFLAVIEALWLKTKNPDRFGSVDGFLPRSWVSGNHAFWSSPRWPQAALFCNLHGSHRYASISVMDSIRKQLDADTSGHHHT